MPWWIQTIAISIVVAAVVAAVVAFRSVDVCNDAATTSGTVVSVCRHLELTDPPVVAVGLLMLAALGAFFGEVSGLGFTLKSRVRRIGAKAEAAHRAAKRASGRADRAEQTAEVAEALSQERSRIAPADHTQLNREIDSLAQQYNDARANLPPGTDRTREMTTIVSKMIAALTDVELRDFDLSDEMRSGDRGHRLTAYAYLYANPDPRRTQELVDAARSEDKPFGQYWALLALGRLVDLNPSSLDRNSERELEQLQRTVGYGSDRWHALQEILERWRSAQQR